MLQIKIIRAWSEPLNFWNVYMELSCSPQTVVYESYLWDVLRRKVNKSSFGWLPRVKHYYAELCEKRRKINRNAERFSTGDRCEMKSARSCLRNVSKWGELLISRSTSNSSPPMLAHRTFSRFLPVEQWSIEQRTCADPAFRLTSVAVWKPSVHILPSIEASLGGRQIQFSFFSKSRRTWIECRFAPRKHKEERIDSWSSTFPSVRSRELLFG